GPAVADVLRHHRAPRVGIEPTSLILIQSQAAPTSRATGERRRTAPVRTRLGHLAAPLTIHPRGWAALAAFARAGRAAGRASRTPERLANLQTGTMGP